MLPMFPLVLTVPNRDSTRGYYNPYWGLLVELRGNIPSMCMYACVHGEVT